MARFSSSKPIAFAILSPLLHNLSPFIHNLSPRLQFEYILFWNLSSTLVADLDILEEKKIVKKVDKHCQRGDKKVPRFDPLCSIILT